MQKPTEVPFARRVEDRLEAFFQWLVVRLAVYGSLVGFCYMALSEVPTGLAIIFTVNVIFYAFYRCEN